MFIHLQKYLQAANDQIAASSITQGPPFCSPFCVLHTHFRPAPLSTWYGTELEQVPMCGTAERPAEISLPFGRVSNPNSKWHLVWEMDTDSVGH